MMIADFVFILCAVVSAFAAFMLARAYLRRGNRLLIWCAICFILLAINNVFLCVDLILLPNVDLWGPFWRHLIGAIAGLVMLTGLILELV